MEQMNRQLLQDISRTKAPNVMRFGNTLQEFLTSLDSETEVVLQVGVGQVVRLQKKLNMHEGKHSERGVANNEMYVPENPR